MSDSHQVRRVVKLLTTLSSGHHCTTSELAEFVSDSVDGKEVSRRQIQRDLRALEAAGVPLENEQFGRELRWWIPASYRSMVPIDINRNEVLAVHTLKGMLRQFRGTSIENDVDKLARKLERIAPGSVLMDDGLVSEVTPGAMRDAVPDDILQAVIEGIRDVAWDKVTYRALHDDQRRTFVVALCRLLPHAGRLYAAAWHPKHKRYITLAVDRVESVERADDFHLPNHVFNEDVYRRERFGVYSGEVTNVILRVVPSSASFFTNRQWHPTQTFTKRRDGSVDLSMRVPINPELVSWIVSWADVMKVLKPKGLVDACRKKAEAIGKW